MLMWLKEKPPIMYIAAPRIEHQKEILVIIIRFEEVFNSVPEGSFAVFKVQVVDSDTCYECSVSTVKDLLQV